MFLITYYYSHFGQDKSTDGYHYEIVENVEDWLLSNMLLDDPYGKIFLINVFPVSKDIAIKLESIVD